MAGLSNYALDNFVAHRISSLTECGAPELLTESSWLNVFIINNVLRVRMPDEKRAYIFNFIRRTEGAFSAYREARRGLMEYVTTPTNVISPYFRSLLNFEICVSQCWQGCELLIKASRAPLFKRNDNTDVERLHSLYTAFLESMGQLAEQLSRLDPTIPEPHQNP